MKNFKFLILFIFIIIFTASTCTTKNETTLSKEDSFTQDDPTRVIYGDDDRLDYYDVNIPWQRSIVEKSAAIIVDKEDIIISGNNVSISDYWLYDDVCETETFYGQPNPGWGSATLIDRQLILTAGHCIEDCGEEELYFVFRNYYKDKNTLETLTKDDVYSCEEVLATKLDNNGDYSIIKLDRPVASHLSPAPVNLSNDLLEVGFDVTVIGFPLGMPAKVAGGAQVKNDLHKGYQFTANLDTYSGSSGSGVYSDSGEIVGIIVDGRDDFVEHGDCDVSIVLPDSDGKEGSTYAYLAFNNLCNKGIKSNPICGESECGDGLCTLNEICEKDCLDDGPAVIYTLIINNGNGDGQYSVGQTVNITADPAPTEMVFSKWVVDSGKVDFADLSKPNTSLIILDSNAEITAEYKKEQAIGCGSLFKNF